MKKITKVKRSIVLMFALLFVVASLSACQTDANTNEDDTVAKVGIIQFAQHASLDNCYEGLIEGFAASGFIEGENLEIDHQNANADSALANQIAKNMVSKRYDLIIGIATPAAQHAYNEASDVGIPVLFTAVTDPVMAGLANEDGTPKTGVTGTSDALPVDEQIQMIKAFFPDAKNIGILYSLSESNSLSAVETYKELATKHGVTIVAEGISEASVIPAATDSILNKIDVLTNLTDNLVVENMPVILTKANNKGIPYFGSEEEQVRNGAIAAQGLDYVLLGQETAKMGAEILNGKAAETIEISIFNEAKPFHNSSVMENFELELPSAYSDSKDLANGASDQHLY